MKKILLILSLLFGSQLGAQNQAANWFFGQRAGVTFDINTGTVTSVNGGMLNTLEGCTSISDIDGNLILYTDGSIIYNSNHQIMPNGVGLYGSSSATQSAIVVPHPGDDNLFYIFTVDTPIGDGTDFGFNYSIVDMSQGSGLGAVTIKNMPLLPFCSEKITAVAKDCQSDSIWVITLASADGSSDEFNSYHAFEITGAGINTNAVVSTFATTMSDARGAIKVSPNGSKLASANMSNGLYLYDFDINTGVVSNEQSLFISSVSRAPYGVEFSPDSKLLYVHSSNDINGPGNFNNPDVQVSSLTQFNVYEPSVQASEFRVDQRQLYRGSLQLGPNGKIYRSLSATYTIGLPYLAVINNPNGIGATCNYQHNAVNVSPNLATQGLPPFIQSFFNDQIDIIQNDVSTTELLLCTGDSYALSYDLDPDATYVWYKDGVLLVGEDSNEFVVTEEGTYELSVEFPIGDCRTFEGVAFVTYHEVPVATQPVDMNTCDDNNDGIWRWEFTTQDAQVLGAQDSSLYSVHYFASQTDAETNTFEIVGDYNNISTTQEIFARVHNEENPNCYAITSFFLEVFVTPIANPINDWAICDDDTDGFQVFDLASIDNTILNGQDPTLSTVTYHDSQADADSRNNPLPITYNNQTAFSEEIFSRIENNANSDCYSTTSFNLIVNPLPVANNASLLQCDEDGNPNGLTLFNLTEANDALTGGIPDRSTKFFLTPVDAQNGANEIDGTSFNNTSNPQSIFVQVINDVTSCFNVAELILNVSVTDAFDAQLQNCDDDGTEDGFYNFDLTLANTDILNGLPPTFSITYFEMYDDALLEQNTLGNSFTNTTPYLQTIYARVENANACYGISQIELTVFELPDINIDDDAIYCLNFFPQPITLDAGLINNAPSSFTYLWSTGETTHEILVNQPGTYTVTVTNNNNCSKDRTIIVNPSNIATIENIEVVDATSNNTITILVSGEGDYEYALDYINGPYQDSNTFDNVSPGLHTVYIRDKNDCGIVDDIVSVIGFPKFFTPNGDTYNDTWQVYGINDPSQFESIIYIFDRYGKLLKQLSPQDTGWDGTFNGEQLPTNDYWFHVTLQDGRVFKSHFTLKR